MKLSVVVGYYDEHDKIAMFLRTLEYIIPYDVDYEVIIVTDKENGNVIQKGAHIKQLFTKKRSFSEAYNEGLRKAKGEYVVIANCDVLFVEENRGWFHRATELLEDDVACVVPKVNLGKIDLPEVYIDDFTLPCFFWLLKNPKEDCFFDEIYKEGSHCEDADKCMQWFSEGKKVVVIPWFTIQHTGGGILRRKPKFQERLHTNKELFKKKWGVSFNDNWLGKLNGDGEWEE